MENSYPKSISKKSKEMILGPCPPLMQQKAKVLIGTPKVYRWKMVYTRDVSLGLTKDEKLCIIAYMVLPIEAWRIYDMFIYPKVKKDGSVFKE